LQRARHRRHGPAHRDDIVEISDVIAVEVGEEDRFEEQRSGHGGSGSHQHAASAVEQQVAARRADQGRGACPVGIRQRAPRAERNQLHGFPLVRFCSFQRLTLPLPRSRYQRDATGRILSPFRKVRDEVNNNIQRYVAQ